MFGWAAAPMAMLAASVHAWGPEGGALLVGQAVLSVLMLEAANYVQHYGLERTKLDNGRSVFSPSLSVVLPTLLQPEAGRLTSFSVI